MKFKERLVNIRKAQGLTQRDVAEKAKMHVRAVQNYELTDRQPKGEFLSRLAQGLGVPKSALLSDEGFEQFMIKHNKSSVNDIMPGDKNDNSGLIKGLTMIGSSIPLLNTAHKLPLLASTALPLAFGGAISMTIASLIGIGSIKTVRAFIDKSNQVDKIRKELYKEISRIESLIVLINDKIATVRENYEQLAISTQQDDADVEEYKMFIQLSRLLSVYQDYHYLLAQKSKYCMLLVQEIEVHSCKKTKKLEGLLNEISKIEKHEHELADVIMKTAKGLSDMD